MAVILSACSGAPAPTASLRAVTPM